MYILSNIYSIFIVRLPTVGRLAMYRFKTVSYYCCMFIFMLYVYMFMFNYVAPWSCEAWHFVPLYVHTCSEMTTKLDLTWLGCLGYVCNPLSLKEGMETSRPVATDALSPLSTSFTFWGFWHIRWDGGWKVQGDEEVVGGLQKINTVLVQTHAWTLWGAWPIPVRGLETEPKGEHYNSRPSSHEE